jgi:hypothetical protein
MRNWSRGEAQLRPANMREEQPLPGVIDTVGLGYAALLMRPQVLLPPILLDLYLWLGLRMTAKPFTARLVTWIWGEGEVSAQAARDIEHWKAFNVFELLSMRLPTLRVPGFVPLLANGEPTFARSYVVSDAAWWVVVLVGCLALCGGFLIGGSYLIGIGSAATGAGAARDAIRPRLVGRAGLMIGLWLLALIGALALVCMPLLLLAAGGVAFGQGGFTSLLLLSLFPAGWGFLYFFFSVEAVIIDRLGPFAAMRASYLVVRRYFWQSARFIAMSLTVTTGFPFALRALAHKPAGLALAIVAHAFIASGMIAAAMLFYRDRARRIGLPAFEAER